MLPTYHFLLSSLTVNIDADFSGSSGFHGKGHLIGTGEPRHVGTDLEVPIPSAEYLNKASVLLRFALLLRAAHIGVVNRVIEETHPLRIM